MMKVITQTAEYEGAGCVVTLGKFDGIHRGHRQLLHKVLEAGKQGLKTLVFTFDRSPLQLFSSDPVSVLFTEQEKRDYLAQLGMDVYVSYPFTKETAAMEPERFIREILVNELHAKKIVVGTDYRFGKQRKGDVGLLAAFAAECGYELEAVEKLKYKDEIISSTRIREALKGGNIEDAAAMLGRPYSFSGMIVHGKSLGHTLGFPTINLRIPKEKVLPPYGVYCSKTWVDRTCYFGISNLGCKPTVQKEAQYGVETHLLGCTDNLYEKYATVQLLHHTRREVQFPTIEALKEQLSFDIEYAKQYFSESVHQ